MMSFQVFRSIYENVVIFYKSFLNIKKIKKTFEKNERVCYFSKRYADPQNACSKI